VDECGPLDDGGHGIPAEVARDKKNLMDHPERVLVLNYPATAPSVLTADVTAPRWVRQTPYPTVGQCRLPL
jgi:hypothetical protein